VAELRIGDYTLVRVGDVSMWLFDADAALKRLRAELARTRAENRLLRDQRDSALAFLEAERQREQELTD
jgi:multidrug resistance efflux pump